MAVEQRKPGRGGGSEQPSPASSCVRAKPGAPGSAPGSATSSALCASIALNAPSLCADSLGGREGESSAWASLAAPSGGAKGPSTCAMLGPRSRERDVPAAGAERSYKERGEGLGFLVRTRSPGEMLLRNRFRGWRQQRLPPPRLGANREEPPSCQPGLEPPPPALAAVATLQLGSEEPAGASFPLGGLTPSGPR